MADLIHTSVTVDRFHTLGMGTCPKCGADAGRPCLNLNYKKPVAKNTPHWERWRDWWKRMEVLMDAVALHQSGRRDEAEEVALLALHAWDRFGSDERRQIERAKEEILADLDGESGAKSG